MFFALDAAAYLESSLSSQRQPIITLNRQPPQLPVAFITHAHAQEKLARNPRALRRGGESARRFKRHKATPQGHMGTTAP